MPTYEFECPRCGYRDEDVRTIAGRDAPLMCEGCERALGAVQAMQRVILTPCMANPDIAPYVAVAGDRAGKHITSRREHREFLKRNNFREAGDQKLPERPAPMRRIGGTTEHVRERRDALRQALHQHVPSYILAKTR